jgi:hypothetical protein
MGYTPTEEYNSRSAAEIPAFENREDRGILGWYGVGRKGWASLP